MSSEIKANKISPATGTDFTLGDSGDTFTIPSGVTLTNSGTATGFGSPAYASNASATDDTVNVDASDNLQFNSGYGSTATAYGCRAWVNFNGTGTVAIRASGNVSSITDNGTGDYTINFTTAMPDANYAATFGGNYQSGAVGSSAGGLITEESGGTRSTTQLQVASRRKDNGANFDTDFINVAIFR
jgi:hypothetical protein